MITSEQCRMARGALNWTVETLARAAHVGEATIRRFEQNRAVPIPATISAMRRALEDAGIEFIAENDGGAGVRLRKPSARATCRCSPTTTTATVAE
jgi:transcriptional regulator with XRE-family HTH domain